ncbi:HPF/RaiA family ribosome-associated protein [bacterium]|nr:HPF/RaiA family ribosome-associated protein [bacterium]
MAINVELHLDHLQISEDSKNWINDRINHLENGHHDITGAYLSVKQLSGKPTVNKYEVKLLLYHKPENIVGSDKSESIPEAIQSAFAAAERQLKRARTATKDRRKRAQGSKVFVEPVIETEPGDLLLED